ncbi:MAG: imidazoleglycerol-phosphate dehydratase [Gemmatimonadetes bacterium]|jgi:imidazoleglycerol-phosphate dehydratase|nr:imidazoleglycerol-phosphate dehydratase [Gemmatimonadota bacterium]HCK09254.1 imidazoleglycerol-phosphate dehydratase HisB [Candidatus Latescibacterota bacterium]|tara:strand:+ start:275 stop:862 length:588 start_codon:yes stop_codon:yes gene_type:complete
MSRQATITRKTTETDIRLDLKIDGSGNCETSTGIGFFDHMLTALARHGQLDLKVDCSGDLDVDAHHTVEDVGICLGQAFDEALGDKAGITRFASAYVTMDEALARAAVDFSGRPYLFIDAAFDEEMIGAFPSALTEEFLRSLSDHARINLHIDLIRGSNAHHSVEAIFKAAARAIRTAVAPDPGVKDIPSTKGVL